jgi:D-alanine-D-alanine ligase
MRITVLTGGTSSERDVAIASAVQIVRALRSRGHAVAVVDTARGYIPESEEPRLLSGSVGKEPPAIEELEALERGLLLSGLASLPVIRSAEVIFLALHGGRGEDGTIQAVLDVMGVTYTGSGSLGSALAMDKDIAKRLFRAADVLTADWLMTPATAEEAGRRLGWPLVVKPSKQGSTVGLTVVKDPLDFWKTGPSGWEKSSPSTRCSTMSASTPRACPRKSFRPTCPRRWPRNVAGSPCEPTRRSSWVDTPG